LPVAVSLKRFFAPLWVFNFSLIFLGFGNSVLQFPPLTQPVIPIPQSRLSSSAKRRVSAVCKDMYRLGDGRCDEEPTTVILRFAMDRPVQGFAQDDRQPLPSRFSL
jgi:hypothetical protein